MTCKQGHSYLTMPCTLNTRTLWATVPNTIAQLPNNALYFKHKDTVGYCAQQNCTVINTKHDIRWCLDRTPLRFPSNSCGFFANLIQSLQAILARFKLKLQSYSYQILDYAFPHSVQYPHAVINSVGGKVQPSNNVAFIKSDLSLFPHAL